MQRIVPQGARVASNAGRVLPTFGTATPHAQVSIILMYIRAENASFRTGLQQTREMDHIFPVVFLVLNA